MIARLRDRRDHRWTQPRLSQYIDRELEPHERARVERHTAVCPQCGRALATLRRTVQALRRLGIDDGVIVAEGTAGASATPDPVAEEVIAYLRRAG